MQFIQEQIFGMKWLNTAVSSLLGMLGISTESRLGGSLLFFLYDSIKITLLLFVLIFAISYIQSFFPPERSRRLMSRFSGLSARIVAALLGTVTPFCSCSSIPIFMGFTQAGLPLGITFSFLISSPMVDLGSLVLLLSIFGWKVAVAYVVLGLVVAVAGGTAIGRLRLESDVADFIRNGKAAPASEECPSRKQRLLSALRSVLATLRKIIPYILAGVAVGALIHNWIPENWILRSLGGENPFGVPLAVVVGAPMYADIFGCIPIAESLLAKGALLGVVLSFMMAVTTLSLPSLVMLRKVVKARLLAVFIAICIAGIILAGYLFNAFQALLI